MDFQPARHRAQLGLRARSCDLVKHQDGDTICREMVEHKDPVVAQTGLKALRAQFIKPLLDENIALWISESLIPLMEEKEVPAPVRLEAAITVSRIAEQQGGSYVSVWRSAGSVALASAERPRLRATRLDGDARNTCGWHLTKGANLLETSVVATTAGKELLPRIVEYTLTGPKFDPVGVAAIYEAVSKAGRRVRTRSTNPRPTRPQGANRCEIAGDRLNKLKELFASIVAKRIEAGPRTHRTGTRRCSPPVGKTRAAAWLRSERSPCQRDTTRSGVARRLGAGRGGRHGTSKDGLSQLLSTRRSIRSNCAARCSEPSESSTAPKCRA